MKVIGNRKPIEYLLTEEDFSPMDVEYAFLSTTFDMYRPVYTNSKYKASNFAYLEYIYRITTPEQDARDAFQYINKSLHFKLNSFLSTKQISYVEALRSLESDIEENELTGISNPNMKICSYSFEDGEFIQEDIIPADSSVKSVCYLLTMKTCYYILYTPIMTFIDGYDPYTGEDKIPFIPISYLEAAKTELLALNEGKEFSETMQGEELIETMSEERVTPMVTKEDEMLDQPEASEPEETVLEKAPSIQKSFRMTQSHKEYPEASEPEETVLEKAPSIKKSSRKTQSHKEYPEYSEFEESVLEKAPSIKKSSGKTQSYYEYPETRSTSDRKYYEPQRFVKEFSQEDNSSDRFTESDYDMIIPSTPDLYSRETSSRNKKKDQISTISSQSKLTHSEPSIIKYNKFDAIPDWQSTENQIKKTRNGCGDSCNII
jgi:hypothetical protein